MSGVGLHQSQRAWRLFTAAVSLATLLVAGGACTPRPASLPYLNVDLNGMRDRAPVSPASAEDALSELEWVTEDERSAAATVLNVDQSGSVQARGYLGGQVWQLPNCNAYVAVLVVPETVDGVRTFLAIPLVIDDQTSVAWQGERTSFERVYSDSDSEPGGYWLTAYFKVRDSSICMADRLEYTSEAVEWGPDMDDGRADVSLGDGSILFERRAEPLRQGTLSLREGERGTVDAYLQETVVSDETGSSGYGFVDLIRSDRLGGATVFHVVRAQLPGASVAEACNSRLSSAGGGLSSFEVEVREGVLWIRK